MREYVSILFLKKSKFVTAVVVEWEIKDYEYAASNETAIGGKE